MVNIFKEKGTVNKIIKCLNITCLL